MLASILTIFQQPELLLFVAAGVWVGMYVGAIPGLTGTMAVSLLISFTYSWDVLPALAVMVGVHVGCAYGGSRAAILINMPGAPCAIATTFDGYPLAQKGQAAHAISVTVIQSTIGSLIACLVLVVATPVVSSFALQFTPMDYFLMASLGLFLIASLGGGNFTKNIFSGCVGILIGCVGMDGTTGMQRFTFGNTYLLSGIGFVIAMIGLFGFSEALTQAKDVHITGIVRQKVDKLKPDFSEVKKYLPLTLQSSLLGTFIGALPGTGGDIAALFAYDFAKRTVKNPEVPFGQGAVEGLVAPESANNATVPAAYIPMLTLGIPGDGYAAVVIGALYIHGLNPGPTFMATNPDVVGVIIGGLIAASCFLLVAGYTGIKAFAKIVEIPKNILMPIIMVLCIVGSYALNHSMVDVYLMIGFGVAGYWMRRHDYSVAPMVLGIILSSLFELNLRRAINMNHNRVGEFFGSIFTHPISLVLFLAIVFSILMKTSLWAKMKAAVLNKKANA